MKCLPRGATRRLQVEFKFMWVKFGHARCPSSKSQD